MLKTVHKVSESCLSSDEQARKVKQREYDRLWYLANKDKVLERKRVYRKYKKENTTEKEKKTQLEKNRKYYHKNREKIQVRRKKCHINNKANPEYGKRLVLRSKKYYQENKEKIQVRVKTYYQENKEKCQERHKEYMKKYYPTHKKEHRMRGRKWRASMTQEQHHKRNAQARVRNHKIAESLSDGYIIKLLKTDLPKEKMILELVEAKRVHIKLIRELKKIAA